MTTRFEKTILDILAREGATAFSLERLRTSSVNPTNPVRRLRSIVAAELRDKHGETVETIRQVLGLSSEDYARDAIALGRRLLVGGGIPKRKFNRLRRAANG